MKYKKLWCLFFLVFYSYIFCLNIIFASSAETPSSVLIDPGIRVLYTEFNGDTTSFIDLNDSELANISGMVLEVTSYGKIYFTQTINLTQDVEDNIIDIDSNVNIGSNSLTINTAELSSLNRSAMVAFYGVSIMHPVVMRDGSECPNTICQVSYLSPVKIVFTITNFDPSYTHYYIAEAIQGDQSTSSSTSSSSSSSSSGGGSVSSSSGSSSSSIGSYTSVGVNPTSTKDFLVDKGVLKTVLKQGEFGSDFIEIENVWDKPMYINISLSNLSNFLSFEPQTLYLNPGESGKVKLQFFSKENDKPDSYLGKMILESGKLKKNVNIIVELKEKQPLFDISVNLDKNVFYSGENLKPNIKVKNLGDLKNIDVDLYYAIKDFDGKIYNFKKESIAIEESLNLIRIINVPFDIAPGDYVLYSKVSYRNITATSSYAFKTQEREFGVLKKVPDYAWIVIIVIIILIIVLLVLKKIRKKHSDNKNDENKVVKSKQKPKTENNS